MKETSIKSIYRRLPLNRQARHLGGAKGRWKLGLRKAIAPRAPVGVTVTGPSKVRLYISSDPVDEEIAHSLLSSHRQLYFPEDVLLPENPLVLDIGGHHGMYAVVSAFEWDAARVTCVEPSSGALAHIERHVRLNGLGAVVDVVHGALGVAGGELLLHHSPSGSWGNTTFEEDGGTLFDEVVPSLTLAQVIGPDIPDVIKCNAEGAEYALIEQMASLGLRPTLLTIAVHPEFGDADNLVDGVKALGYDVSAGGSQDRPMYTCRLSESVRGR